MPSPAELSKTERLGLYARALRPAQPPFYVQHPTRDCPLMGWWWQPAGAVAPEPLASNYDHALFRLVQLRDAQQAGRQAAG
jgi:hypothetical protein